MELGCWSPGGWCRDVDVVVQFQTLVLDASLGPEPSKRWHQVQMRRIEVVGPDAQFLGKQRVVDAHGVGILPETNRDPVDAHALPCQCRARIIGRSKIKHVLNRFTKKVRPWHPSRESQDKLQGGEGAFNGQPSAEVVLASVGGVCVKADAGGG